MCTGSALVYMSHGLMENAVVILDVNEVSNFIRTQYIRGMCGQVQMCAEIVKKIGYLCYVCYIRLIDLAVTACILVELHRLMISLNQFD